MSDRLLTWDEWLYDSDDNIPFELLDATTQLRLKADYEYDRDIRLTKQDAKTCKAVGEWLVGKDILDINEATQKLLQGKGVE